MFAQQDLPTALQPDNQVIRNLTHTVEDAGWLYFTESADVAPTQLFNQYKVNMGLGDDDDMVLQKVETDNTGWTHRRYQQYYKELRVEGAEYTEHIIGGKVRIANGKILENANLPFVSLITEQIALEKAKAEIDAVLYAWEELTDIDIDEDDCGEGDIEPVDLPQPPVGELLIAYINQFEIKPENYALAWKFEVASIEPNDLVAIYVDALTGNVLKRNSLLHTNGPANLLFGYGTPTIDTKFEDKCFGQDYHYLHATDNDRNVYTKIGDFNAGQRWGQYDEAKDDNDCWGCGTPAPSNIWTTAHWGVSESWDYFKNAHNRNGMDNEGAQVKVLADAAIVNAFFTINDGHRYVVFGQAPDGTELSAIDIGGHEFTHGVVEATAGLVFEREPGALNESFADIFGFMVERRSFPGTWDWTMGEDALLLRSLANPSLFNDPDTHMGTDWIPTDAGNCPTPAGQNDNCGVHTNSGVQNFWFHLLSVGGTHNGVTVQGIGIDEAADISYFSLAYFLQEQSQYTDARQGAIAAATLLFGDCSEEVIQVTNAWAAVGVGNPFGNNLCLSVMGPEDICDDMLPVTYEAFTLGGSNVFWNIPTTWNTTVSGFNNNILTLNSVTPPTPNTHIADYSLFVSSSAGNTVMKPVSVIFQCEPDMPYVQNPNGDFVVKQYERHFDSETLKGGISSCKTFSDLQKNEMTVYPNPTTGVLNVSFTESNSDFYNLQIYNATGRQVSVDIINCSLQGIQVNLNDVKQGVYYLQVTSNGVTKTTTFVKL